MRILIVYKQGNKVKFISPSSPSASQNELHILAKSIVPLGQHYAFIPDSELPFEHSIELWDINDDDLNDGIGEMEL